MGQYALTGKSARGRDNAIICLTFGEVETNRYCTGRFSRFIQRLRACSSFALKRTVKTIKIMTKPDTIEDAREKNVNYYLRTYTGNLVPRL